MNSYANKQVITVDMLRSRGFEGFVTISELRTGKLGGIPSVSGVYIVTRDEGPLPAFRKIGTGGYFKNKNPNVAIHKLERKWVDGAYIMYIGNSKNLHKRIRTLLMFGKGATVPHWGGRYIWQLEDAEFLRVCYKRIPEEKRGLIKKKLLEKFCELHAGMLPFANLI